MIVRSSSCNKVKIAISTKITVIMDIIRFRLKSFSFHQSNRRHYKSIFEG